MHRPILGVGCILLTHCHKPLQPAIHQIESYVDANWHDQREVWCIVLARQPLMCWVGIFPSLSFTELWQSSLACPTCKNMPLCCANITISAQRHLFTHTIGHKWSGVVTAVLKLIIKKNLCMGGHLSLILFLKMKGGAHTPPSIFPNVHVHCHMMFIMMGGRASS